MGRKKDCARISSQKLSLYIISGIILPEVDYVENAIFMPNIFEPFFYGTQRGWDFPPANRGRRWEIFSLGRGYSAPKDF